MAFRTEIDLTERPGARLQEHILVFLQKRLQFFFGGFHQRHRVAREELQLLPQPTPNDRVITIQSQFHRLSIVGFLQHKLINQSLQFLLTGRPLPGLDEDGFQLLNSSRADNDLRPLGTAF